MVAIFPTTPTLQGAIAVMVRSEIGRWKGPHRNEETPPRSQGSADHYHGSGAAIDCTVRNLSGGGACLKVASPIGVPDTFDLVLDDASVRHCRVTWRKATQIGVAFG